MLKAEVNSDPVSIYLFKATLETLEKDLKYVQS